MLEVEAEMPIAEMSTFNLTKHEQGYMRHPSEAPSQHSPMLHISFPLSNSLFFQLAIETAAQIFSGINFEAATLHCLLSLRHVFISSPQNPPDFKLTNQSCAEAKLK